MNNIEDNTNNYCSGCAACVSVCPTHAIEYRINEYGFYQAFVNKEKCINCGKCKKVCVKYNNSKGIELDKGVLYAAKTRDEETLKSCTSGGIAYEISKYGIENGYSILGTVYDYDNNIAKAIITDNYEDLELLKGSKYIQSNMQEATSELLRQCKENPLKKFIVFGTPCQIAGISKMIENEKLQNEIIKIDLFCHGVPSYVIWNQYLKELKEKYNIDKMSKCVFRSKHHGWHQFCFELKANEGEVKYISNEKSEFYKIFFDNMFLNHSCYNCEFRKNESYADIRLGDFWGKKYHNDLKGISAVLLMTEKGKKILNEIESRIDLLDECKLEECFKSQSLSDYSNYEINKKELEKLKEDEKLETTIKRYRKTMSTKKRMKLKIEEILGKISPRCKYNIKKFYYRISK